MSLALVIDNTAEDLEDEFDYVDDSETATPTAKHTKEEKEIYRIYALNLKARGFCKLTNSASNFTQIFNRFDGKTYTPVFLTEDFCTWRKSHKKKCSTPTSYYLAYSLEHIVGQKFIPGSGNYHTDAITGCTYANTWRKYELTTDTPPGLSPDFEDLFLRLLPAKVQRDLFLQYLAHIFQRPSQRPSWHCMFADSDSGVGKGFLMEFILDPLLKHTQVLSTYAKLTGQHSTTLADSLLVLLDDCVARSDATQTAMKSMLSEQRVYIERKYAQGGMEYTYTRFILASNEPKPLDLEPDDRRWFIADPMKHRESPEETQQFLQRLYDWIDKPGSLDAMYQFFMNVCLKDFNHKFVVKTQAFQNMVKLSKGIHGDLLADFILDNEVFTTSEWMAEYERQSLPKLRDAKAIPALLLEAGYEKGRPTIRGIRETLCYPLGWTPQQIEAVYPKEVDPSCTKPPY